MGTAVTLSPIVLSPKGIRRGGGRQGMMVARRLVGAHLVLVGEGKQFANSMRRICTWNSYQRSWFTILFTSDFKTGFFTKSDCTFFQTRKGHTDYKSKPIRNLKYFYKTITLYNKKQKLTSWSKNTHLY